MPQRNDPCPCGSGKKYKHCHLAADDGERTGWRGLPVTRGTQRGTPRGARPARHALPPAHEIGDDWEIGVDAMPITFDDDPDARPIAILVAAGPLVLHLELISRPPPEPDALAALVAGVLTEACAIAGKSPRSVAVRDADVARALARALAGRGVDVRTVRALPAADEATRALATHLAPTHATDAHVVSHPERWSGWGLPAEAIGRLHAVAAAFYRAAPWADIANDQPLVTGPGALGDWTAVVMGAGGQEFGLAIYRDVEDLFDLFASAGAMPTMLRPRAPVLTVVFGPADGLPALTRREVRHAGWEIAGPRAWPQLIVLGTPGGGVTAAQLESLITRLAVVPRFVAAHRAELRGDGTTTAPDRWRDPATGLDVVAPGTVLPPGPPLSPIWARPVALAPCGPKGPGARPGETLDGRSDAAIEADARRLMEAYMAHVGRTAPSSPAVLRRAITGARFVRLVMREERLPLAAVTEHELRQFLYLSWPFEPIDSDREAAMVLADLRAFFSWMRTALGVRCPWATAILADRDGFLDRWYDTPVGTTDAADLRDWTNALYEDLELRALVLPPGDDIGVTWSKRPTPTHVQVDRLAHRRWLVWRDEVIRGGITAPEAVHAALMPRLEAWFDTPHADLGGRTPRSALAPRRGGKRQ